MKYPEEILRERLLDAEAIIETVCKQRDAYKQRLEGLVEDMYEDLWKLRNEIDQEFAHLIEVVEDAKYA